MIKTLANKSYVPIAAAVPSNFYKATFQKGNTKIVGMVFTFERSRQGCQSEAQPGSTPSRSVEPRTPAERYLCDKKGIPVVSIGYFSFSFNLL